MNNKEFISELAARMGFSIAETQRMVTAVVDEAAERLQNGDTLSVTGFGTFDVKKKMERVIINPATQQRMLVPPKLVLDFKAVPRLKDKIKGK
ncbi:MAG: HU family DNA-binding protein [Prevotella sp.]|nr:HU family DNA-binding protein [Prevotella sp.]MDO5525215.1 HU family DNA-binding protein [Prevotella sp.]